MLLRCRHPSTCTCVTTVPSDMQLRCNYCIIAACHDAHSREHNEQIIKHAHVMLVVRLASLDTSIT